MALNSPHKTSNTSSSTRNFTPRSPLRDLTANSSVNQHSVTRHDPASVHGPHDHSLFSPLRFSRPRRAINFSKRKENDADLETPESDVFRGNQVCSPRRAQRPNSDVQQNISAVSATSSMPRLPCRACERKQELITCAEREIAERDAKLEDSDKEKRKIKRQNMRLEKKLV